MAISVNTEAQMLRMATNCDILQYIVPKGQSSSVLPVTLLHSSSGMALVPFDAQQVEPVSALSPSTSVATSAIVQHVRVVRLVERRLQLLKLLLGEDRPVATLPLDVRVRVQEGIARPEAPVAARYQPDLLVQVRRKQILRLQIAVAG
uniref:Uncharacterized protein n=1 Tax=Anopheles atroparvus TaxID=41427 RepID=A0A182IKC3_ANOAO